jgi:hypothetical protein
MSDARSQAAHELPRAIEQLQQAVAAYRRLPSGKPPRYPVEQDYAALVAPHARVRGLSVAAGLGEPPPLEDAGLFWCTANYNGVSGVFGPNHYPGTLEPYPAAWDQKLESLARAAAEMAGKRRPEESLTVPDQRPAAPTAGYCLLHGYRVRWNGETRLRPQLWRMLSFLLGANKYPLEVGMLEDEVWDRDGAKSKTMANAISALNIELATIEFPWAWHLRHGQISLE